MKKKTTFLSVALALFMLLLSNSASAQFTELWKVSAGTWPLTTTSASRGAALNRSNGHYLVTNRDLPRIYVYNASNGTLLDSLNMTGVAGGGGSVLQDIEITNDGVVYATNLILNGLTEDFKIYRWANDSNSTVPTVAFSGKVKESARLGDCFDVAGTGTGTVIYVGGNNSGTDSVQVFTTADGDTFTNSGSIKITANDAGMGIAQVVPGGDFLTSRYSTNNPIRLYSGSGAGRLESVPTSVTAPFQADITCLEAAGRRWIASVESVATAGHNHKAVLLNATYGLSGAVKVGVTPAIGTAANTSSIGADVELQYNAADSTMTIYLLVDNNGIAAYKTGNLLLANLAPFAGNFQRTQYVPFNNQPDTIFVDVQDDDYIPQDSVWVTYNVNGGIDGKLVASLVSGDSTKGTYRAIISGSNNTDGKRISYSITVADNNGVRYTSATQGYFAGVSKAALSGVRAVDENGDQLYNGYAVRLKGICVYEDSIVAVPSSRNDVVVQDDSGAVDIVQFTPPWRMKRGNVYIVTGLIGQYNGRFQLGGSGQFVDVVNDGPGILPKPKEIMLSDLTFDKKGELLENSLVMIHNVRLAVSSAAWPSAGAAGTNLTITDNNGMDSVTLRVPALSDANGFPPLQEPFTLIGTAAQFDGSAPRTAGYQIIMRHRDDVVPEVKVVLNPVSGNVGKDVVMSPSVISKIDTFKITAFQFTVTFDSTKLQFKNVSKAGTISEGFTFDAQVMGGGMVRIAASSATALKDSGALFNLAFAVLKPGKSIVDIHGQFNEGYPFATPVQAPVDGSIPYDDPQMIDALPAAAITVDGKLDEPAWAGARTLIFGPSNAPKMGGGNTVTGGFDVKASFDVNGVTYHLPYKDTSYTRVKFLRKGTDLYIGIQSPDKSICKFDWEGDGLFVKIKNSEGVDKEYKLYYQNFDSTANKIKYEESILNSGSGAGFLGQGSTVNDTTNADSGYTAELRIKLASLGYDSTVNKVQVAMTIFDPDGFQYNAALPWPYGMSQWDSARGSYYKSWWGSEWGGTYRTINLITPYDDPDTIETKVAKIMMDGKIEEAEWSDAPTLVFGTANAPTSGKERTVTGGIDVKATFDVNGVTYHLPSQDVSATKVKFLQYGSDLYIGIQSPDKSICKFDWEGDGIFVQIKNKANETKEYKLYYQNFDSTAGKIKYEESVLNSGAGAGFLNAGSTVNDTNNVDNGYTAELRIKLAALGYTNGDKFVPISINIFDPDGFQYNAALPWPYGMTPWDSARGSYFKSWWGSEWGSSFRTIALQPMTDVAEVSQLPTEYALQQNYPNPFNPTTNIRYSILQQGPTTLVIYDLLGREVRTLVNETVNAGNYEKTWDGKNNFGSQVASGIYIYRIQSGSFISTKKMMLLK